MGWMTTGVSSPAATSNYSTDYSSHFINAIKGELAEWGEGDNVGLGHLRFSLIDDVGTFYGYGYTIDRTATPYTMISDSTATCPDGQRLKSINIIYEAYSDNKFIDD